MPILIKRVYDPPSERDGTRLLIDRLWPRGLKRDAAALDGWLKDLTPSHDLRRWFHASRDERWPEFRARYRAELDAHGDRLADLAEQGRAGTLTLLTAAREPGRSHAVVLKEVLESLAPLGGVDGW